MKVYVGLSGGVDSAVSAAILKSQGFEVVGAFIKIWSPEFTECTWREDRLDAMRVCVSLKIPYKEIDLSEEYKTNVAKNMVDNYARGITPNPDVLCNESIKFGSFARWAFKEGADLIATGHYAQVKLEDGRHQLCRGKDVGKDQSYFLYRIRAEELSKTLFPVGGMEKTEVREKALEFDLPNAVKKDSQGLCFVGDITLKDFLSHYVKVEKGAVVNEQGEQIGTHDGAILYTIGQRHGLYTKASKEHFVKGIDVDRNVIVVAYTKDACKSRGVTLTDVHWIFDKPASAEVQIRYRDKTVSITGMQDFPTLTFSEPQIIAKGQSVVFYDGEKCLGGGIVADLLR